MFFNLKCGANISRDTQFLYSLKSLVANHIRPAQTSSSFDIEACKGLQLNDFQGVFEASKAKPLFVRGWACINTPYDFSCRLILKLPFHKECANRSNPELLRVAVWVPMQSRQQSNHSCRGEYTLGGFSFSSR